VVVFIFLVGFTTTSAIVVYHNLSCKFKSKTHVSTMSQNTCQYNVLALNVSTKRLVILLEGILTSACKNYVEFFLLSYILS
jgi:hypothetical protein